MIRKPPPDVVTETLPATPQLNDLNGDGQPSNFKKTRLHLHRDKAIMHYNSIATSHISSNQTDF